MIIIKLLELVLVFCIGVSFRSIKLENDEQVIYIDPGHGGMDGGCVGHDGTFEKDINLQISFLIRDNLEKSGLIVNLTRNGDYDLSNENSKNHKREDMEKRCELLNKGKLFVSIHTNEYQGKNVKGAQVFYYGDNNKLFANIIQNSLKEEVKTTRKALEIKEKYLLINTNKPGCIVEVGFMSNPNELKLLKEKTYQKRIANAISIGIIEYIKVNQ